MEPPPPGVTEDIRAFDQLGLSAVLNPWPTVDVIGGNHHARHFLPTEKGHKYVTHPNPTPCSLKPLLESMKEPSVLVLRGCDQLLLPFDYYFPFEKFKTLTSLEISGVTHLTTLPEQAISKMTCLQNLTLSHLPIQQLPDDFFSYLTKLRSLAIRGCSYLHTLPHFPQMDGLKSLDLSHLLIETLPEGCFSNIKQLRWLILKGCSKLSRLSSDTHVLENLEVLDLSHCTDLLHNHYKFGKNDTFKMLDLSFTSLPDIPGLFENQFLTHLFLRDVNVTKLRFKILNHLEVLDLSGAQNVKDLSILDHYGRLRALDLSRTGIESIDNISGLNHLCYLILRECVRLIRLPAMRKLTKLQVLDISGCEILDDLPKDLSNLENLKELNLSGCSGLRRFRKGLFDKKPYLEKLDLSKTRINHLPSLANLTNLRTLNLSQSQVEKVKGLRKLINLREIFCADCPKLKGVSAGLQTLADLDLAPSGSGTLHLVSTFFSNSGFDKFKQGFNELVDFISNIHGNSETNSETSSWTDADFNDTNAVSFEISAQTSRWQLTTIVDDLEYILHNIDLLESSSNGASAVELLNDLMNASYYLSPSDFKPDSPNLLELHRMVVKLKLLVPPPTQVEKNEKRNKKMRFKTKFSLPRPTLNVRNFQPRRYFCLTDIERKCLLYLIVILKSSHCFHFKERALIQLWYGEGFIGPQHEENVSLSNTNSIQNPQSTPNQNQNPDPTACSNPNPEIMGTSIETGAATTNAKPISTTKGVESPYTIEEIGRKILTVLEQYEFIKRASHNGIWYMSDTAFSAMWKLVTKGETQGQSAYLVSTTTRMASSSLHPFCWKHWPDYEVSSKKLGSFENIGTLFTSDEPAVDIRAEWFSKMRNLNVLHLGRFDSCDSNPIEVVDLKFLEELKNMKQLRLLSLEGFPTISKLPESVCNLTNLKVLNLRECSYLEQIPVDIGSLENLTHLDLTDCHVLSKLPKGVGLLSNLEVLKGFVITYQVGGRQHRKACTLRELLNLEKLRKLNLVVNTKKFPSSSDLQILKEMKNLCNLKITWEKNYTEDQETQDVDAGSEVLRRWQQLKFWEVQTRQSEIEEQLGSNHLDKLKKLVMCCFPLEITPDWLHPSELPKLEKLYIMGGQFTTLAGADTNQNKWNVKNLCLKYLQNLEMDWKELRKIFPNMTYFKRCRCDLIRNFHASGNITSTYGTQYWVENEDDSFVLQDGRRVKRWY